VLVNVILILMSLRNVTSLIEIEEETDFKKSLSIHEEKFR